MELSTRAAKKSVNKLFGVKGISNNIKIKSETHDAIEKKISNALSCVIGLLMVKTFMLKFQAIK